MYAYFDPTKAQLPKATITELETAQETQQLKQDVEKEDSIFRENFDAIVGLAYPNFAEKGITPFFDNMI